MRTSDNFKLRTVAGENVLVNVRGAANDLSTFFSVNEPTAWLWRRAANEDFTEEMLVEWLCSEFEVGMDEAAKDVHDMVELWRKYGMVE